MATSIGEEHEQNDNNGFILGIDIGTTNIKTSLVNKTSRETVAGKNVQHFAEIMCTTEKDGSFNRHEQVVDKILTALNECISQLPDLLLKRVRDVVICGQMHGCVLWNKEKLFAIEGQSVEEILHQAGNCVSNLITWEDGRCSTEFLHTLPKPSSGTPLASGFGCATLFWLQRYAPKVFENYDCAGTIMDLVVACICRSQQVYISSQNACSWGYYDVKHQSWEVDKLIPANFPTHLLPVVCEPGFIVGQLSLCWFGIPSDTTIRVSLGDMQCSILATASHSTDAVLNIGTSAQLSVVINKHTKDFVFKEISSHPSMNLAPYFNNCWLVVAAALTGGNTLAFFVKMLRSWMSDLGLDQLSNEDVYEKLSERINENNDCPELTINPVLWGERHDPNQTASVTNITPGALSLGNVYNSLCHGILVNIHTMMSRDFLEKCGVRKITGTGNALVKNSALQKCVCDVFDFQFALCEDADASVGAALSVM